MSNETQETIADILAAKRESEATCEKTPWVGNTAKMREALAKCMEFGKKIDESLGSDESTVWTCRYERSYAKAIEEIAKEALAEPLRNCDVGTAEEQIKRHRAYCKDPNMMCGRYSSLVCRKCFAEWAQMPYEKEGAK